MEKEKLLKKKRKALEDGNLQQIAIDSENLASYYNENELYEEALSEFKYVASTYEQLGDKMEKAKSHRMIGEMFMLMGKFTKALHNEMIYLNVAKEEDNKIEIQRAYATIGRCHLLHGQSLSNSPKSSQVLQMAENSFNKSILICKELTGKIDPIVLLDMQARLYLNLGVAKEHLEELDQSVIYTEKAIQICQANDFNELLHQSYITVAQLYQKQNDSTKSLRFFNKGLEVCERLTNHTVKMCETLMFKADVFIKIGDFQSAKQILHRAYKLKTTDEDDKNNIENTLKIVTALCYTQDSLVTTTSSTNFKTKKDLYEKMGDGSCKLQSYSIAIIYYLKMLEYAIKNDESGKKLIPIYVSLYQTYKDNKQFDLALDYLWKEFELCKDVPIEAFTTLLNIGDVYQSDNKTFFEINDIYERARLEAKKMKNKKLKGIVLFKMVALQKSHGMSTMAAVLEEEARASEIDLINSEFDTPDEDRESDTPDIGGDICLDNLSDFSSDPEVSDKSHNLRKRVKTVKKNSCGETQLHQACMSGNLTLCKRLIDQGYPLKIRDNAGWLALHEACLHGHKDIVELILDGGGMSLINDKGGSNCEGITPIYDACSNGHLDTIELLLNRGAIATVKTDFNDNCLSALEKWKESVQLELHEVIFYDSIRERITEKFEQTGASVSSPIGNIQEDILSQKMEIEDDSTSDDSSSVTPSRNLKQVEKSSKLMEYKSVMENLRTRNKEPINRSTKETKRTAYMQKDEVGDNWLDKDVILTKKKQKIFTDQIVSPPPIKVRQEPQPSTSRLVTMEVSDETSSDDELVSVNNTNAKQPKKMRLLSAGFSRVRSESPTVELTHHPNPTRFLEKSQKTNSRKSSEDERIISVKVKIEEQFLLVPFNMNTIGLTIEWLGQEAAKRYYNLKGICPELRLMTADGAIFEGADPISLAISESFITTTVLNWHLPPLEQRYLEACTLQKTQIDKNLNSFLEISLATQKLTLNDQQLSTKCLQPVFKALRHQNTLWELNLSENLIQDEDVKNLVSTLPTLENLRVLNLSGNMITSDGIKYLANDLNVNLELMDLDLSFNPLHNKSLPFLSKCCNNLEKLKKLKISSCEITNFDNENLNFSALHQLDLSYNILNIESIRKVLSNLNSCHMTSLNLSFCTQEEGLAEHIAEFLSSGTCQNLKELSLMSCNLNDADIWEILRSLPKSIRLESLKLTGNSQLTSISFRILLNSKNLKYIKLLGCTKMLIDYVEVQRGVGEDKFPERIMLTLGNDDQSNQIEKLKKIWEQCWDERWRIKCSDMNVVLFVDGDSKTNYFQGTIVN